MTSTSLRIGLLGPLQVTRDGRALKLGGTKPRLILALLALDVGRAVSTDRLIDALWPGDPPAKALGTLQAHVSAVRRALADPESDSCVTNQLAGYTLDVDPVSIDSIEFTDLAKRGRALVTEGRYAEATVLLRRADELWRGDALADLAGEHAITAPAAALDEARLAAIEVRLAADLGRGGHAAAASELRELVASHPLREDLWALLMLALYRSDRQADALTAYRTVRETLLDELGIDPGPKLQDLERAVLTQDPELDWRADAGDDGDAMVTTLVGGGASDTPNAVLVSDDGARHALSAHTTLGRHPASTILVDDQRASRRHATIRAVSGGHLLSDLASTNGTTVNGDPISDRALCPGDEIQIGETQFRYELG